jgi:hypothetical protein
MSRQGHRIGILLGLSAVLAATLAFEILDGPFFEPAAPTLPARAKTAAAPESQPLADRPPISAFDEIVQRPLFAQTRRPPAPKAEVKIAEDKPEPEAFDLVGVVISPNQRMALLRTATNEVLRAGEGQTLGGWEVHDIKPTQVVLQRGDESQVLKISKAADAPSVNAASAGEAAPPLNGAAPPGAAPPSPSAPAADGDSASVAPASPAVPVVGVLRGMGVE